MKKTKKLKIKKIKRKAISKKQKKRAAAVMIAFAGVLILATAAYALMGQGVFTPSDKGDVSMPTETEIVLNAGSEYTFDVYLSYTASSGAVTSSGIHRIYNLRMFFSDTSLCERTAYDTFLLKETATEGTKFTVRLYYKGTEQTYNFTVSAAQ